MATGEFGKILLASDLYHILGAVPGNTPICCEHTCDGERWYRVYFSSVALEKGDEEQEETLHDKLPISGPVILLGGETMIDPPKGDDF